MPIPIILITGHATAGKDTLFTIMDKLRPGQFARYAFADQLKEDLNPLCRQMFGKPIAELTATEKEIFRPVLISYGCAWRAIDPDHWVKIVDRRILWDYAQLDGIDGAAKVPVVTDCRFANEANYFTSNELYRPVNVIRVTRTDSTYTPPSE